MGKYHVTLHNVTMVWRMVTSHVTVTVCHMTKVTWGPWESKCIAMVVKCISSREMSENSIEFSLSNSEQRDSWLNSGHQTLDADKLYNWQRTFWLEWWTDNPRYQAAVSQEHDARCQPILRLPWHDVKYFTYATWVFHRWVNWSPTYCRVQDNAMGYGKMPIIRFTRVQSWTPAGGHSTVPGIRSTKCQNCTNEWIFDLPFGPKQAGQCQVPIIMVTCYTCQSTLSWKTPPDDHKGSTWVIECA